MKPQQPREKDRRGAIRLPSPPPLLPFRQLIAGFNSPRFPRRRV